MEQRANLSDPPIGLEHNALEGRNAQGREGGDRHETEREQKTAGDCSEFAAGNQIEQEETVPDQESHDHRLPTKGHAATRRHGRRRRLRLETGVADACQQRVRTAEAPEDDRSGQSALQW